MARTPITMRYVKDILRLKHQNGLSVREIAGSCGLPASTVGDYLQRAQAAGLNWPLPEGISDSQLMEQLMKPAAVAPESGPAKPLPDWPAIHEPLRRKGVTLQLLWREYHQAQPEGYRRNQWFEAREKPALLPLPAQPFELAIWGKATVNIDYHAVVDYHGYSVPYQLIHREPELPLNSPAHENVRGQSYYA